MKLGHSDFQKWTKYLFENISTNCALQKYISFLFFIKKSNNNSKKCDLKNNKNNKNNNNQDSMVGSVIQATGTVEFEAPGALVAAAPSQGSSPNPPGGAGWS